MLSPLMWHREHDPAHDEGPLISQGPFVVSFTLVEDSSSGEKLAGRDHRVACPTRFPHESALLHSLLHPLGVQSLHSPCQHSMAG